MLMKAKAVIKEYSLLNADDNKKKISLTSDIKTFGKFTAQAKLYSGILASFDIEVSEE